MSPVTTAGRDARPSTTDRRAAERYPVNAGACCACAHPVVEAAGPVRIRDMSMDGVGLLLTRRVEVGALLAVGLAHPAKGLSKTVLVRVGHVTPSAGGYLVGGSFETPLTYQKMTALVM